MEKKLPLLEVVVSTWSKRTVCFMSRTPTAMSCGQREMKQVKVVTPIFKGIVIYSFVMKMVVKGGVVMPQVKIPTVQSFQVEDVTVELPSRVIVTIWLLRFKALMTMTNGLNYGINPWNTIVVLNYRMLANQQEAVPILSVENVMSL